MEQEISGQPEPREIRVREKIEAGINDLRDSLRIIARKGLDSGLVERVREGAYGVLGEAREALERFSPKRVQAILAEGLAQKGRVPGGLAGRVAEVVVNLVSPENEGEPLGEKEKSRLATIFEEIGGKRLRTAMVNLITMERGEVSLGEGEPPQEEEEEPPPSFGLPSVPQEYKAAPWWGRQVSRRTFIAGCTIFAGTATVVVFRKNILALIKGVFYQAPRATGEKIREEEIKKEPGGKEKVMAEDIGRALGGENWGKNWEGKRNEFQEMFDALRGKEERPLDRFVYLLQHNMTGEYRWFRVIVSAMYEAMKGYGSLEEIRKMLEENKYSPEEIGEWEKFYQAASQTDVGEKESFQPVIDWVNERSETHSSSTQ